MARTNLLRGMLALFLTFGLSVLAHGQSLNGTWVNEESGITLTLSNGSLEGFITDGAVRLPLYRGTYTTNNQGITITLTQLSTSYLAMVGGQEVFIILDIGSDPAQMYSRNQLGIRRGMEVMFSSAQLREILDILFITETIPVSNNRFTFSDVTFTRR